MALRKDLTLLIIAGTIAIDPDAYDEFMGHAATMMAASRAEDGCHAYVFTRDAQESATIHLYELWEDSDALAAHAASDHMKTWRAAAGDLVSERSLQIFTVTDAKPLP